jgi:hypothetical protein
MNEPKIITLWQGTPKNYIDSILTKVSYMPSCNGLFVEAQDKKIPFEKWESVEEIVGYIDNNPHINNLWLDSVTECLVSLYKNTYGEFK